MPLVRISLRAGRPAAERAKIGDAVYRAMRETLDVPVDDRFQIITEHAAEALIYDRHYLGIARSDDVVFIQVFLRRGRTVEKKQAFYRRVADLLGEAVALRREDVFITLAENDLADWSFGNGVAQYVER